MKILEHVSLASVTTFRIGGDARVVCECESVEDIQEAAAYAASLHLPIYVIGGGSNILASDAPHDVCVLHIQIPGITYKEEGDRVQVRVGAGVVWDALVTEVAEKGLWGLENLAGIPGLVGACPVQNIGAYGAEVQDTITRVEGVDLRTGTEFSVTPAECEFAYRDSVFKRSSHLVITYVTFTLSLIPAPRLAYKDIALRVSSGEAHATPLEIGALVRSIRGEKFPDLAQVGTAGSFFKNPIITREEFSRLKAEYPELPGYEGSVGVKISLAWILDHVLHLRNFTIGNVSLFERQPLVVVAAKGATAHEVDALASEVGKRVHDATGIEIEREVRAL